MKTFIKYTLAFVAIIASTFVAQAQVKVGNNPTVIAAGSAIEIESTNKALRMPQISLTNTTTWAPMLGSGTDATSPGMHVYNTNPAITSTTIAYPTLAAKIGEYYWDGKGWVAVGASSVGQTSALIYAGSYLSPPVYVYTNAPSTTQVTNPDYDPYNGYSAGIYTIPFDGWFVLSHLMQVSFNGPGASGSFTGYIAVKPIATGVEVDRGSNNYGGPTGYVIPFNNTLTIYLKLGDQVRFHVIPCQGCTAGSHYSQTDIYQTITAFK